MSLQLNPPVNQQDRLPRFLIPAAWASFILNVLIIATGGAVRLTGSGLGCSEWPLCTPGSLTPTPETGIHGIIEFANRTISGPVLLAGLIVLVLTLRMASRRKDLRGLSIAVVALVILQALVGAFVVWESLAAVLVGFHYSLSVVIVCLTAAYVARMYEVGGPREFTTTRGFRVLTAVTTLGIMVIVFTGVMTTAAGPHSGDANVIRDGFDATFLSHLHAWPGYITLALNLVLLAWSLKDKLHPTRAVITVLALMVIQILVGVYQARNGLPVFAVGVHMVLASLSAAATTVMVLRLKRPVTQPAE